MGCHPRDQDEVSRFRWTKKRRKHKIACGMGDAPSPDDRLKGALLVAATLTAAIRLRGEPINNSPKVMATIQDSIKLAQMVLRGLNYR